MKWAWLRPVARGWARVRDLFPLTFTGACVVIGSSLAFQHYGLGEIDLILLVVGAVGLFVAAAAFVCTLVGIALTWWRLRRNDDASDNLEVECGHPVPTRFSLARPWWLPLCEIRWTWSSPRAEVQIEARRSMLHEHVVAARRGAVESVVRRIEVGDSLGLSRMVFEHRERRSIRFLPSTGALRKVDVVRGMAGGDDISHPEGPPEGDLYDLRHYTPGDPIRFVLWNVFARTRQLVVRTPERALSYVRQTTAYMISASGDEPAAGAARLAIEQGVLGEGWSLGVDGNTQTATHRVQAMDIIARSANGAPGEGQGLAAFLSRSAQGKGRIVVFVPGRPGQWIERVEKACAPHRRHVELFVCVDGIVHDKERASWWSRGKRPPVVEPSSSMGCTPAEISEVLRGLSGAASQIRIIDRAAGRMYASGQLMALAS